MRVQRKKASATSPPTTHAFAASDWVFLLEKLTNTHQPASQNVTRRLVRFWPGIAGVLAGRGFLLHAGWGLLPLTGPSRLGTSDYGKSPYPASCIRLGQKKSFPSRVLLAGKLHFI
jgi:hypothetical protein